MNNKIIIAGAIVVGLYLFSQTKTTAQKVAQRIRSTATLTLTQKIAQKVAQMDISELPVQLLRHLIAHAAAQEKTGKEVVALEAEVARREAVWKAAQKVAPKRIGQPTTQAAHIAAALRKAAVRKAAAQKIGKIIGKKVAQKIPLYVKTRRAVIAQHAKRQRPQIQRPLKKKKQIASRLFPGAEKSRIIPYSESSKHSYYGPKSHRLQNEGYGKGKAERDRKQALEFRLNELRTMFPLSNL